MAEPRAPAERSKPGLSDQKIELIVGNLLIVGVCLSAALVVVGGIAFLIGHANEHPHFKVFKGEPADLRGIPGILEDVRRWDSRGVIQLGLLVLLATPVARVAFSLLAFMRQRDKTYVVVTCIVLTVLLYSLFGLR
jgi:uncharacterized membrane protein